jgi:hypothetical protein
MQFADNRARRRNGVILGAAVLAAGAMAASAALIPHGRAPAIGDVSLSAGTAATNTASGYQFLTLNDRHDTTFNQLLGINDSGLIVGYFGSGGKGHPNKGYWFRAPYAQTDFTNENVPGSVQTQVTGLNDNGITVGFFSTQNTANNSNNNFGFVSFGEKLFRTVVFPTGDNAKPQVDQLLGVSDAGIAVGFYTNGQGSSRGFEYNIATREFTRVLSPGFTSSTSLQSPSLTASAINNHGDVAGFYNKTSAEVVAFLKLHTGRFITIAFPGAAMTQAFGVNDSDEVVGTYTMGSGNSATQHGFVWRSGHGFTTVDDPAGIGSTNINGVNDEGDLVGFYTDSKGNTDSLFALP